MQIHDIEFAPSVDYVIKNTLPVIVEAREKGLVKYIGVTGYPVSVLKEFIEKSPVKVDMVLSYARLNLIDDTLKHYLPYFQVYERSLIIHIVNFGEFHRVKIVK